MTDVEMVRRGLSGSLQKAVSDQEIEALMVGKAANEVVDHLETVLRVDLSGIPSSALWNELARRAVPLEFQDHNEAVARGDYENVKPFETLKDAAESLHREIYLMADVADEECDDFMPPVGYGTYLADAIERVFGLETD